jgi:hypothetical protein
MLQSVTRWTFIGSKTVSDKEVGEHNDTQLYVQQTVSIILNGTIEYNLRNAPELFSYACVSRRVLHYTLPSLHVASFGHGSTKAEYSFKCWDRKPSAFPVIHLHRVYITWRSNSTLFLTRRRSGLPLCYYVKNVVVLCRML